MRRQMPGELADQRGLAGAVGTDDGMQLALRHFERDMVGRDDAAEPAHQFFHSEQGFSHVAVSPTGP